MITKRAVRTCIAAGLASALAWPSLATAQEPIPEEIEGPADTAPAEIRGNQLVIPKSTRLGFTLAQTLSSKQVKRGDLIKLTLRDDIRHEDKVIVPAGTPAVGEVTRAQENGFMGRGGRLAVRMLYLDLERGPVRVSGPMGKAGKDQTALATAVSTVTFGFVFFVKGKSAVFEEGAALDVALDREARIPLPADWLGSER